MDSLGTATVGRMRSKCEVMDGLGIVQVYKKRCECGVMDGLGNVTRQSIGSVVRVG